MRTLSECFPNFSQWLYNHSTNTHEPPEKKYMSQSAMGDEIEQNDLDLTRIEDECLI